jgi:hypothetical protein
LHGEMSQITMRQKTVHNIVFSLMGSSILLGALIGHFFHSGIIFLVFVLATVAFVIGFSFWYPMSRKAQIFSNRESMTDDDIYKRYYSASGLPKDSVLECWRLVAKTLSLPVDKLRPDDEFGNQLGPYWPVGDPMEKLEIITVEKLKKSGIKTKDMSFKTLDEYIRALALLSTKDSKK